MKYLIVEKPHVVMNTYVSVTELNVIGTPLNLTFYDLSLPSCSPFRANFCIHAWKILEKKKGTVLDLLMISCWCYHCSVVEDRFSETSSSSFNFFILIFDFPGRTLLSNFTCIRSRVINNFFGDQQLLLPNKVANFLQLFFWPSQSLAFCFAFTQ